MVEQSAPVISATFYWEIQLRGGNRGIWQKKDLRLTGGSGDVKQGTRVIVSEKENLRESVQRESLEGWDVAVFGGFEEVSFFDFSLLWFWRIYFHVHSSLSNARTQWAACLSISGFLPSWVLGTWEGKFCQKIMIRKKWSGWLK